MSKKQWKEVVKKTEGFEGKKPYMYVDTTGHVTTAVGLMLPSATEAEKLPFIHEKTDKPATKEEIKKAYNDAVNSYKNTIVKKDKNGKPVKAPAAGYYKGLSDLRLKEGVMESHLDSVLKNVQSELRKTFKGFDSMPVDARKALMDMGYNLGVKNIPGKFPHFTKAIKAEQWKKAAEESHREKIQSDRNEYVFDLLNGLAATLKK